MEIDVNTTYDIYDVLKNHSGPIISESGFKNKEELLEISSKTNIKTFLIGESLLKNLENLLKLPFKLLTFLPLI